MSIRAMSIVWASAISPPSLKLCALALADWSNDEGGSLHPSMSAIAKKVGVSHSQAQRLVQTLKSHGLLSVAAYAHGGAPGCTPHYRLHLDRLANMTASAVATGSADATGSTCAQRRVALMRPTGSNGATQTTTEPSMEPPGVATPPSMPTPARRRLTARPKEVTLAEFLASTPEGEEAIPKTDAVFRYAERIELPREFLRLVWLAFRRRYLEDQPDKVYVDWRAVFRRAVCEDWLKLWRADPAGGYVLTTAGVQEQRAAEQEAIHGHQ